MGCPGSTRPGPSRRRPNGSFIVHAQRIRIDGFDLVDGRIVRLHPGMDLRVEDAVEIPLRRPARRSPCHRGISRLLRGGRPTSYRHPGRPTRWPAQGTIFHSGGGVMVRRELKMLFQTQKVK